VVHLTTRLLEGRVYDEKVDMWAAGVILFNMLTGKMPFPANNKFQLTERVKAGKY
jgi:serine/threonine protein kinase